MLKVLEDMTIIEVLKDEKEQNEKLIKNIKKYYLEVFGQLDSYDKGSINAIKIVNKGLKKKIAYLESKTNCPF